MKLAALAIVLAVQFGTTAASYAAIQLTGWRRRTWFGAASIVVLFAPVLIGEEHHKMRLVAALWAAWMGAKVVDLYAAGRSQEETGAIQRLLYLFNPTWLVHRLRPASTERSEDVRRLLVRGGAAVVLVGASVLSFRVDWARLPFAVEHTTKALLFISAVTAVTNAWAALWRLAGGRAIDVMGQPLAAATPAEFWRRWNRPAQQFFRAYAFDVAGGARRPARAMLAAFVISALGHEYIFSIAAGRLQGYQMAFFLINGLAAVATFRVRPVGWRRVSWTAATLAFVLATSVLFGRSVNEILPVYALRD